MSKLFSIRIHNSFNVYDIQKEVIEMYFEEIGHNLFNIFCFCGLSYVAGFVLRKMTNSILKWIRR